MKRSIFSYIAAAAFVAAGLHLTGCTEEVDNAYSRFPSVIDISASAESVILDETKEDEVALTITWTQAKDYGEQYFTTYIYSYDLAEHPLGIEKPEEDATYGEFVREYTHKQLQDLMIDKFGWLTSSWGTLEFNIEASFQGEEGSSIVLPDTDEVAVRIKTYGPKQFAADKVFLEGTAVGESRIELSPSANNADLYVYNGVLAAGSFNFPVIYGDENNVIIPASGNDETIASKGNSDAAVVGNDETAYSWIVEEEGDYRISLNMATQSVSLMAQADIMEVDKLFLEGSAVSSEVEITRTLENDALYAWRGELSAGTFTMPIEFGGERNLVMVPAEPDDHGINDGNAGSFTTVRSASVSGRYWEITEAGTYRIVVDTDALSVTIYSEATDMEPKTVVYKRTQGTEIPDFTMEVTTLYMWSSNTYNSGSRPVGGEFVLTPSLANPRLFIYKGSTLKAGENLKFIVSDVWNNEYAYGSSDVRDFLLDVALGEKVTPIYGGQSNNRYSYFKIPENTNYVEVYIGGPETDENENALSKCWGFEGSYVLFDQR